MRRIRAGLATLCLLIMSLVAYVSLIAQPAQRQGTTALRYLQTTSALDGPMHTKLKMYVLMVSLYVLSVSHYLSLGDLLIVM